MSVCQGMEILSTAILVSKYELMLSRSFAYRFDIQPHAMGSRGRRTGMVPGGENPVRQPPRGSDWDGWGS